MGDSQDDRIARLADRQAIHDCLTRMCRGTDRFDRDLFLSAFHPDARIAAGPFVGNPADLYDWSCRIQAAGHAATLHNILNHHCEIDGDTAHAETYCLYVGVNRDATNVLAGGRYIDRFDRRGGEWRIAARTTLIEYTIVVDAIDNPLVRVADIDANGIAARSRDDISYRRPFTNRRAAHRPD